jgi:hypothetical protein
MSIPLEPATRLTPAGLNKFVRDLLANEIAYRRERREQIFTWASTVLIAIIGGTIALTSQGHALGLWQRVYLSLAIFVLAVWMVY